jgi:multidrug efflux pump subunit AcrB
MVVFFFGVLLLSLWYAQNNMEFILFPSKGADSFFIGIELPTGTSLRSTSEKVKEIETIVESLPAEELGSFSTRIGTMGWVWEGEGEHHAFLLVNLTP